MARLLEISVLWLTQLIYICNIFLTYTKKSSHITQILCRLHWQPVRFRIKYKILLIIFKALHGLHWSSTNSNVFQPDTQPVFQPVFRDTQDTPLFLEIGSFYKSTRVKLLGFTVFEYIQSISGSRGTTFIIA